MEIIGKFPAQYDADFLKDLDKYVRSNLADKNIQDIKAKDDFKIADITFREPKLKKISEIVKRKRIELYLAFNKLFLELRGYINVGKNPKVGSMAYQFY